MGGNTTSENSRRVLGFAVVFLALAIFLYFFWGGEAALDVDNKQYPSMAVSSSVTFEAGAKPKCFSDNEGFYFLMGDGIKRYEFSGKTKWDYPLNFTTPVFVENGGYVGAGEYKGAIFYAFSSNGLIYSINADQTGSGNLIVNFSIGANGYSAITFATPNGGYIINAYDAYGALLTHSVAEDKNNYPISTAVSPDGRILAVSYLNISGTKIHSYICAYYLSSNEGGDFQDGMFASFQSSDNEIISKIGFIDDANLMFASDGQYGVYEATKSNQMELKWKELLNNQAAFVDIINNKGIAIVLGKSMVNKDGLAEGTLIVYAINGEKLIEHTENGPITYLSCAKSSVIIGGGMLGRKFTSLSYKNKVLWEYSATSDVYDFVALNKPERTLMVIPGAIEIMEKTNK